MKTTLLLMLIAIGLGGLPGCARESVDPIEVRATLTQTASPNYWYIDYSFSKPVNGFSFQRQMNQFRKGNWTVETPGLVLDKVHGQEVVYSTGGRFQSARVAFRPFFGETPRDYEFFIRFTDSSVLLFTGHINAFPMICGGADSCLNTNMVKVTRGVTRLTRFVPARPNHVILKGQTFRGESDWFDLSEGAYVYFGQLEFQEDSRTQLLADPQIPRWIQSEIFNMLPRHVDFFEEKTGYRLGRKPLLFLSRDLRGSGADLKGAALAGQIQITFIGTEWERQSTRNLETFNAVLAHELAHLWNGDLFYVSGTEEDAWLHEGGAEAFAHKSLLQQGVIDSNRYVELVNKSLYACAAGLEGISLKSSHQAQRSKNFYDCGWTANLMAEAYYRSSGQGDLFELWRRLFGSAAAGNHTYTPQSFIGLLSDLSWQTTVTTFIETILPRPAEFIFQSLARAGVAIENSSERAPESHRISTLQQTFSDFARSLCGEEGSVYLRASYIKLELPRHCLVSPGTLRIESVEGIEVTKFPIEAGQKLSSQCSSSGRVSLKIFGKRKPLEVSCRPFSAPPPFWRAQIFN